MIFPHFCGLTHFCSRLSFIQRWSTIDFGAVWGNNLYPLSTWSVGETSSSKPVSELRSPCFRSADLLLLPLQLHYGQSLNSPLTAPHEPSISRKNIIGSRLFCSLTLPFHSDNDVSGNRTILLVVSNKPITSGKSQSLAPGMVAESPTSCPTLSMLVTGGAFCVTKRC